MTGTTPDPHSDGVDPRLRALNDALLAGLTTRLDVEAGLRDVLLHSQAADSTHTLKPLLDIEAGLAAILPAPAPPPQPSVPYPLSGDTPLPPPHVLSASELLALRRDAVLTAVAKGIDGARDLDPLLDRLRNVALNLDHALDHGEAHALDHARGLGFGLALDLARIYGPDRDLDPLLEQALIVARDLDRALDRAHARALRLAHALDRAQARAQARDLARGLARAIDLAHRLASLLMQFVAVRISRALRRAVATEDVASLFAGSARSVLDDFTDADLSTADLSSADLIGIRWTRATRWPAPLDIGKLRRRSRETAPGSNVWVVVRGGNEITGHVRT
ncbi:hypothetical protein [Streptomyces violascens]|uniref:hypothetical protein n=1 Tax=Streptomyces violascens TaxID=67381 RepID=UPI00367C51CD